MRKGCGGNDGGIRDFHAVEVLVPLLQATQDGDGVLHSRLLWQMFAMGIIGWLAGVLYRKGVLRRGRLSLCIFGVIASTIIYGGIMNPASALMWSNTINWKIILSYYVTGLPVDLVRAIATFFFLWLIAEPMLEKLDRVKVKYGLAE